MQIKSTNPQKEVFRSSGAFTGPVCVAIADDSAFQRQLLRSLIAFRPDARLSIAAESGEELLRELSNHNEMVHVCILDMEMGGVTGLTAAAIIHFKFPEMKIYLYTASELDIRSDVLREAGVLEVFSKGETSLMLSTILDGHVS